jgi:peptide/nickel transport system substrate-binding protein
MNNTNRAWQLPLVTAVVGAFLFGGCGGKKQSEPTTVTIAVEGDVDGFNPLFTEEIVSGEINDLIYPRLVAPEFDAARGILKYSPSLAKSWEFSADHRDLTFHLRTDARWSDGTLVTARDVQFSFVLYGDTTVASVRQSIVQNFRKTNGKLDISKSVELLNDSTVVFHFDISSSSQLFDVGVPILPYHILSNIPRNELRTHRVNKTPVTSGPFALVRWIPMQSVVLSASHAAAKGTATISQLVFKVLPEHRARVAQLQSGEVDIVSGLRLEDTDLPSRNPSIEIISNVGRDYDFIGWNNIDPDAYVKSEGKNIQPNRLFGSAVVRRALTMAINRNEIVRAYLGRHGQEAIGGISPLFKWAYNDSLKPLPFDQSYASTLLEKEGWKDLDGDGVLEKKGVRFSFTLKLASGNQLRDVIAAVVQQQLRAVNVEMKIEQVERGTFWNELMQRKYDAWFAGFSVPLQMQLDDLWGSDLKRYPFNLAGYRNKRVDEILTEARKLTSEFDGANLWKEFQVIVHYDQPYTFLFWVHNIVGVNKRVKGTHIGILGTTHKAWEWQVETDVPQ